jgi:ABC-type bacteriocin/lantibiotic exporter with double-glycine peptidase domain
LAACEETEMLLDLPDVRQTADHACGSAVIECVRRFWRVKEKPADLSNEIQGLSPDTLAAVLRAMGCRVRAGEMLGDIADLQHYTKLGMPVCCPITVAAGGHWVVVRGVARRKVWYQCPTWGPSSLPLASWLDCWRDVSAESLASFDRWGVVVSR